jgi:hypothetical protein
LAPKGDGERSPPRLETKKCPGDISPLLSEAPKGLLRAEQDDLANTVNAVARTQRDVATEEWEVALEHTYGALIERFGKKKAERFFPRATRKSPAEGEPTDG